MNQSDKPVRGDTMTTRWRQTDPAGACCDNPKWEETGGADMISILNGQ